MRKAVPPRKRNTIDSPKSFHSSSPRSMKADSPRSNFYSNSNSTSTLTSGDDKSLSSNMSVSVMSSVIGHDDPTAVMGNIRRSEGSGLPSFGSMLTSQTSQTESRNPPTDASRSTQPRIKTKLGPQELREQLSELDRAEEQWQAKMLMKSPSSSSDDDGKEVAAPFYEDEAGASNASPQKRFKWHEPQETILECADEESENEGPEYLTTHYISGSSDLENTRGSESISRVSSSSNESDPLATAALENSNLGETNEIVRQVQQRLMSQENNIENNPHEKPAPSPFAAQGRGYIPIGDEEKHRRRGRGLAAKTENSTDEEDSNSGSRYPSTRTRRRRRCLLLIFIALLLAGASVAIYFTFGKSETSTSKLEGGQTGDGEGGQAGEGGGQTGDGGSGQAGESGQTNVPTASPTSMENPTVVPAGTAAPSKQQEVVERLNSISGDLVKDPSTPQHAAYQWLVNDDPANLDLDSLTDKDLTQRYVAALLYFSMAGDDWKKDLSFMQSTSVCEWRDNATGKGIRCNPEGTVDDISISKFNIDSTDCFRMLLAK